MNGNWQEPFERITANLGSIAAFLNTTTS